MDAGTVEAVFGTESMPALPLFLVASGSEAVAVSALCVRLSGREAKPMSSFSEWDPPGFFLFIFSDTEMLQAPLYADVMDRSWNPPDRDQLVAYLCQCPVVTSTPCFDPIVCPLCGETLERMASSQQSDGLWFWFTTMIHYVHFHHVRLPDPLVERIRSNEYRPPA